MKKIFKKNQVIITALAIMIVIAGYLNFTSDKQLIDTSTDKIENDGANQNQDDEMISASVEDSVPGEDFADLELSASVKEEIEEEISEENDTQEEMDAEHIGEAILTNGSVTLSEAKMNREQVRAKSKEMLLEIINNEAISEESKKDAINKMLNMTENMEKENAAETQLAAKGFANSIVSISEECVDVTVNCESLTDKERTQIEDIIVRKTGCELNKIVLTTVSGS